MSRPISTRLLAIVASVAAFVIFVPQLAGTAGAKAPAVPGFKLSAAARAQIAAVDKEKASRTPAQRKIESHLLYMEKKARNVAFPAHFPTLPTTSVSVDASGQVLVDVEARMTTSVLRSVQSTGGHIVVPVPGENSMRLRMPLTKIEQLAASPDISFIKPAEQAETQVGAAESEGDTTHAANTARSTYSVDGTGMTIGVLSDGVDSLADSVTSGDLPGTVTVLSGQAGDGDEGTAMLEIVHDVAPGAALYFATAFNGEASFAQNIRDLRTAGCDIIVDDVFYFAEGRFQDDTIAKAVNDVTASGALYFSSAGNSGNADDGTSGMWEGDFRPYTDSDGWVWADFDPSASRAQWANPIGYTSSTRPAVLQWADPLAGSRNDYDLWLLTYSGTVVDSSVNYQNGTQDPYERVDVPPATGQVILIRRYAGASRYLGLSLNRGHYENYLDLTAYSTPYQTSGHSATNEGMGVAAAPAHDPFAGGQPTGPYPGLFTGAQVSETFTSDGPRRMFFSSNGAAYTPGNYTSSGGRLRYKPDITAADGVQTTVPGFIPFYGTSAAAPHAAAIAALVKQARPGITPAQVRGALTGTAIDIEGAGWDRDTGAGIIMANSAVQLVHDNNPAAMAFQTTARSVKENAGTIYLTVVRTGVTSVPVSVGYSRVSGSATPNVDFVMPAGTLSFAAGQTSKTFALRVVNDRARERDEGIIIGLNTPGGYSAIGSPSQMVVTILASDQQPDGWIRSSSPGYIGNNIYNTTARGQTKIVTAHRREGRSFYVRIFNDGTSTSTFVIRGSRATPGGSVRYYYNGTTDVTTAMRSAAGWKRTVTRGASVLIKVRISSAWNATIGTTKSATVTAAWGGDVVLRDTVKAGVKVVR